jgi:protoporphyrinogen/coproporphyrinogen III oxidase
MSAPVDVAIIGGGITGLSAAHRLRQAGMEVAVFESSPVAGGKVRTEPLAGVPVECGPDGFLARGSNVGALCWELGLGERLVSPARNRVAIWSRGRLRFLPEGLQAGLPSRPAALAVSRLLSLRGALRAALDLVLPATTVSESTTVAEALERRFGREARQRLVDPLIGGIYAGDSRQLALADALPNLYAIASRNRSLLLALRGRRPSAAPAFQTLSGGLQQLTDALAARLLGLHLATEVTALNRLPGGRFELSTAAGAVTARAVIVAVPAFAAAKLLKCIDTRAAELLAAIPYASVATVALAYPRAQLQLTRSSGFLVPPCEGRLVTAATWVSEKWPHKGDDQIALVRCSVGRVGDEHWRSLEDDALLERVRADLRQLAGVRAEPIAGGVTRWERALPQYQPGHGARVVEIEARLARYPWLLVAGAAYRGIGIAACVAQAERAAAAAAESCQTERAG